MAPGPGAGTVTPMATPLDRTHTAADADRHDHAFGWRTIVVDVAPVVVLGLITLAADDASPERTLAFVVLPLLVRRLWPVVVLAIVATAAVITAVQTSDPWVQVAAVALASFTLGERLPDRTRSAVTILVVAGAMSLAFTAAAADPLEAVVFTFVIVMPAWLIGDIVRTRRDDAARRAQAAELAIRERERRLRDAAIEERRHVARELHDVVAHAVSVMVIQAGAARQVLRSSPDQAEEALLAVESTGREAMTELRGFLGALSDGVSVASGDNVETADDGSAGIAPQPGIG